MEFVLGLRETKSGSFYISFPSCVGGVYIFRSHSSWPPIYFILFICARIDSQRKGAKRRAENESNAVITRWKCFVVGGVFYATGHTARGEDLMASARTLIHATGPRSLGRKSLFPPPWLIAPGFRNKENGFAAP